MNTIKENLKKRFLLLPIIPVILIEAFVLNRSLKTYLVSQNTILNSPDNNIALGSGQEAVLGASTSLFGSVMIEHLLLAAIIVIMVGMVFLWVKTPSQKSR